jgi:hypothetical protein
MLDIVCSLILGVVIALSIGFFLTWGLNPTATPREILGYWKSNFKKNRKEGRLF